MIVHYLGLFDWKNKLLPHQRVREVAKIFIGQENPIENPNGWFSSVLGPSVSFSTRAGMSVNYAETIAVTHSRIIVTHYISTRPEMVTFTDLREARESLAKSVEQKLRDAAEKLNDSEIVRELFGSEGLAKPFLYLYPLIILNITTPLYANEFVKTSEWKWRLPADMSTTCFFAVVQDAGKPWYSRLMASLAGTDIARVYMRISGASLIMGPSSNALLHRIINMLYYSGLYQMTREENKPKGKDLPWVHTNLEPLLEKQGYEITNAVVQRTTEEKITSINNRLLLFTIILLVLTAATLLLLIVRPG